MNLKFLSNFNDCLLNNDFFKIENIIFNKDIYFKTIGTNGYLIVPISNDENYKECFNTVEEYSKIILKNYNLSKIFIIKILIGENFSKQDINFLDYELNLDNKIISILWGVDLLNKKMIKKSNQPTKFLDIEKYINSSLKNDFKGIKLKKNNYVISKNSYLTYATIFIIMLSYMLTNMSIDKDAIIYSYGISPNLFKNREFYRLITFLFLHSGIMHLLSNLLSLYIFGTRIEKYLGKKAFLLIFFIGGISSGIFSIIFTKTYSIGASGAIFALESATLYFSIKEKIKLDGLDYYTIGIFCVIGILASFSSVNIDNAGHIGGFIMGFIVCFIYYNTTYKKIINK
ncbi:rhomboid family intramembrane serine protease [[Clostridium] colinum]|uniref:rhomboid family intramembrane serine protease n=1 Tax=[Clostridium] colinum TaxID=36835 RepID=UPI002024B0CD|nr:rhomboid family intramembrane serine protease [[Clostridium] colinum]